MVDKAKNPDITEELHTESKRSKNLLQTYKTGTLLTLNIDQIDFYDKNPRITKNEKYDEVYVSIKAKGLEGTLSVSQRPDNDDPQKFLLFRGGNTRLAVLKALYEETQDKKYYEVNALFHEWISESDTLIGHLTENDSRGDYVFIDRALGVRESKLELEKEAGEKISDKGLIRILTDQGYKLSKKDLVRMNYAVDIMYPHCPTLLASGIGPFQLDAIKRLNVKAAELCLEINPDKKPEFFTQQFAEALARLEEDYRNNNEENPYNYQKLYNAVLKILSNEERIAENRIEFFLDNRINAKADQQQAFDPNYVAEDDKSIEPAPESNESSTQRSSESKSGSKESADNNSEDTANDRRMLDETIVSTNTEDQDTSVVEHSITNNSDLIEGVEAFSPLSSNNVEAFQKAAALHPTTLDYSVSINPKKHLDPVPWRRDADYDSEFTYLNNLPISCGDRRELAPLPDDLTELRYIMQQKAAIFQQYLYIPGKIVNMNDGIGFVLEEIPSLKDFTETSEVFIDQHDFNYNPLVRYMDKPIHGWWILLGLSNIMVLAHVNIDFAKQVIPPGNLRDYISENHKITQHEKLFFDHKVQLGRTHDLFNLFLSRARPKELQLFIEMLLISNKIFKVTNGDIWGLNV